MLFVLAIMFLFFWGLGLVTSNTMGGLIHVLLAVAIVAAAVQLIQRRRLRG